jgi:3-isopropylmalate/(R)-2-methylmalate dehydratase small subunit
MALLISGRVWKFGADVNTDYMAPSFLRDVPWEQAKKRILHIHQQFTEGFEPGDVIVAGENFGCGSSRERAPANLKKLGVGCVVAESFGRIFLRTSVAIAFPVLICRGVYQAFEEGEGLELDYDRSLVRNSSRGIELHGTALPPELITIFKAGGMMQVLKAEAAANSEGPPLS